MARFSDIYRRFEKLSPDLFFDASNLAIEEYGEVVNKRIEYLKKFPVSEYRNQVFKDFPFSKSDYELFQSYLKQAWKNITVFTNTPQTKDKTDKFINVLEFKPELIKLAQFTSMLIYGKENLLDFVGVKNGFCMGHLKIPEEPKIQEKVVTYFSQEELQSQLLKNPLIPVAQKQGHLILMGKEDKSNSPLLFSLTLPTRGNLHNNTDITLMLHVGGLQPKLLSRISYKPTGEGLHQQVSFSKDGKVEVNNQGIAKLETIETRCVHLHDYVGDMGNENTAIFNPRHYTSRIVDNDYLQQYSLDSAIEDLMDRYNIVHVPAQNKDDRIGVDQNLISGILNICNATSANEELLDYLPVTVDTYETLRCLYEGYIKTGVVNENLVSKIDNEVCENIENQNFEQ